MRFVTLQYAEMQDLGGSGLEPTPGRRMHINADHIISLTETDYRGVTRIRVTNEAHHRDVFGELDAVLALCADPVVITFNPSPEDTERARQVRESIRSAGLSLATPGGMAGGMSANNSAEYLAAQRAIIANEQQEALTNAAAARRAAQGDPAATPSSPQSGYSAHGFAAALRPQRTEAAPSAATSPRERVVEL
jgi:hypothetical protein